MRAEIRRAASTWCLLMRARGPTRLRRTSPPLRARVRGVALLIVMVSVAVLGALTSEFAYESRGAILAATNAEAEVHAFFHARSAMEIARLVVLAPKLLAGQFGPLLAMAKSSGASTQTPQIWAYACKFAEIFHSGKVEAFGLDLFDLGDQKGIGVKKGSFSCETDAEDGRVNVNLVRNLGEKQNLFYRLYPVLRSLRGGQEEDDREAIEAVLNIIDYADSDDMRSDVGPNGMLIETGGGEEKAYIRVDHEPKNAPFDTISELRLVPEIDDGTYCLLRDRATVYLTEKINVNTADLYVLRALICENLSDPVQQQACQHSVVLGPLAHPVDLALGWLELCRKIRWALFTPPFSSAAHFSGFFNRLPAPLNTELRINTANLSKHVATDAKIIRVRALGEYGRVKKRLEGVIDTTTGRYVYWKEN